MLLDSALSRKNRRAQRHYREAVQEIFEGMQHHLAAGKQLTITGFGTFSTRMHKGGKGMNLHTKTPVEYPAHRRVSFRPGSLLKTAIRRKHK